MHKLPKQELDPSKLVPLGAFTACAVAAQSSSLKKKFPGREYVRAGDWDTNITHESERGWPPALRLVPGSAYQVEYWEVPDAKPVSGTLPSDEKLPNGLAFYSIAHPLKGKDEFDARRSRDSTVGVWTDGLMLRTTGGQGQASLVPAKVYKVMVTTGATS